MSDLFTGLKAKLSGKNIRIVFPEGLDERVLPAAARLAADGVLSPILIGSKADIEQKANELGTDLGSALIIDPNTYENMNELVASFVERRKGKATEEQARKILLDENYF